MRVQSVFFNHRLPPPPPPRQMDQVFPLHFHILDGQTAHDKMDHAFPLPFLHTRRWEGWEQGKCTQREKQIQTLIVHVASGLLTQLKEAVTWATCLHTQLFKSVFKTCSTASKPMPVLLTWQQDLLLLPNLRWTAVKVSRFGWRKGSNTKSLMY